MDNIFKERKKFKKLLVLSLYPEATEEMYGSQIDEACYGNVAYKTFDGVDCESITQYDVILVHLVHIKSQIDIMPALSNLGLIIGMTTVERLYLIEDPDLCHGYDEKFTKAIRTVLDGMENLSQCDIINILDETTEEQFFDKLSDEFNVPRRFIGYYTDNEEWIKKKFAMLLGEEEKGEGGKDPITVPIPPEKSDIDFIPRLTKGYIYSVWYGKYSAAVFKPNKEESGSVVFNGKNNYTIVIKQDKCVEVHVWIKPSNYLLDSAVLNLFDEFEIDVTTTSISALKKYIDEINTLCNNQYAVYPFGFFTSRQLENNESMLIRAFASLVISGNITIQHTSCNSIQITSFIIREEILV